MSASLIKDIGRLAVRNTPGLRNWHYRRRFLRDPGTGYGFWGVYSSFNEAQSNVPPQRKAGCNHPELTAMFQDYLDDVLLRDYPMAFWFSQLLETTRTLFDLGGNIGVTYYRFQRLIKYPESFRWIICDVPEIVRAGGDMASQRKAAHLSFTTEAEQAELCDVYLTCGAPQYLSEPFFHYLRRLKHKPPHLIINNVPMTEKESFVTLQNLGASICPYRISNRAQFLKAITDQGYSIVDDWQIERSCEIPLHPEKVVPSYRGMYFKRNDVKNLPTAMARPV
jgi:putative methyltransferase (TIGR04325 family)